MAATATDRRTAITFLAALVGTVILALAWLAAFGVTADTVGQLLRGSGRAAFAVLIAVFVARPLQQLLRCAWTATVLRNRKQLGVAFAGIHTAHFGLILYKVRLLPEVTLASVVNVPGALVYSVILAMLVTSFSGPARALGAAAWKALHRIGLYLLFAAFLLSQLPGPGEQPGIVNALLIALAAAGVVVRSVAFLRQRLSRRQDNPHSAA